LALRLPEKTKYLDFYLVSPRIWGINSLVLDEVNYPVNCSQGIYFENVSI